MQDTDYILLFTGACRVLSFCYSPFLPLSQIVLGLLSVACSRFRGRSRNPPLPRMAQPEPPPLFLVFFFAPSVFYFPQFNFSTVTRSGMSWPRPGTRSFFFLLSIERQTRSTVDGALHPPPLLFSPKTLISVASLLLSHQAGLVLSPPLYSPST